MLNWDKSVLVKLEQPEKADAKVITFDVLKPDGKVIVSTLHELEAVSSIDIKYDISHKPVELKLDAIDIVVGNAAASSVVLH